MLKVTKPLVSVEWLQENFEAKNLIILDATIPKVGAIKDVIKEKTANQKCCFL